MPWDKVMSKWKAGTLKSGGSGKPVTDQKQAIAIYLSEKRKAQAGKREYQSKRKKRVLGSFRSGGQVPMTGLYKVHAGETVIPAGRLGPAARIATSYRAPRAGGSPSSGMVNRMTRSGMKLNKLLG